MTTAQMVKLLHEMVEQLETYRDDWIKDGIYPLHKVTFTDRGESITLVVGIDEVVKE